jgi:hypothetical protein
VKLIGSVALHLFLMPVEGRRSRVDVKSLVHADVSSHLRLVAQALREVAVQLDAQASPIVTPPGLGY